MDCPFRKQGGVRHGAYRALQYISYFVLGRGSTFPCHRSVSEHIDRNGWSEWQEGQHMCAGGLIFAEKIGSRSFTLQSFVVAGHHDPATLTDREAVFDSVDEMVQAHDLEAGPPCSREREG